LIVATVLLAVAINTSRLTRPGARAFAAALVAVTALVVAFSSEALDWRRPFGFATWPPRDWQVAACDVGQGDGLVFRLTQDSALVSDVGSDPEAITTCLRRLKVAQVPIVVLTHFHSDHAGAIAALMPFEPELIAITALQSPPQVAELVAATANNARIPVRVLASGDQLELGTAKFSVIWPPVDMDEALALSESPENDASLVFLIEQKTPSGSSSLKALITGDIELAAQAHLARNWPLLQPIDIYKVPHHGSRIQDERLATLAGAKHAVISVGADNDFGHPNPETLASLSEAGMQVHRTDLSGDIAFSYRHGELIATSRG
jgi:competence protein ComEC